MKFSLEGKLALLLLLIVALTAALGAWAAHWLDSLLLGWVLVLGAALFPVLWIAGRAVRPIHRILRGLSGTVASFREGDFSLSLGVESDDELGDLVAAHNELAGALREQRAHLVQRELLLDTVMQNSPVALVLVDAHERVAVANIAARKLLNEGRSLVGLGFVDVLLRLPPALREAAKLQADSLFSAEMDGVEVALHLSQRSFL